jgi:transposase
MNPSYSHIGIDVAKDTLDLHVHQTGHAQPFPNTAPGHRQLIAFLQPLHPQRIVLEASGGYEKALLAALVAAALPVCCIQPQDGRHFAKALKIKAKNDRIDARVLARLAHDRPDLRPVAHLDTTRESLRQLVVRRQQLVDQQTMEKNHLEQATHKVIRQSIRRVLARLEKDIALIEREIDHGLRSDPQLQATAQCLDETRGIGAVTTSVLVACLPELGRVPDRQLNSLVVVAPFDDDSGPRQGRRCIAGGRQIVRNVLYMACLAATLSNPVIAPFYHRLRARGLAHKSAMMACIRKMLAYLNHRIAQLLQNPLSQPQPTP